MYPGVHAVRTPEKIAAVMAETGESITYRELEDRSVRLAHVLHDAGLRPGDVVALVTENNLRAFEVYWAALRSGLFITAVSDSSSPDEIAYIVNDSGAKALVVSAVHGDLGLALSGRTPRVALRLVFGGALDRHASYEDAIASASNVPFEDQPQGAPMLYSSGTTGRPKGIRPLLPSVQVGEPGDPLVALLRNVFGLGAHTVYLSPAPIYHTAPLRWSGAVQAFGGTVVMLRKFDARAALAAIERYRVTYAQFVPTMFVRLLKLPEEARTSYDLSSLTGAVHAAAPCPVEVKDKMIAWWGPILDEYYGGTEGIGVTVIDAETWLAKRGSVGKPVLGIVRICADETGDEVPIGETGIVYFERENLPFEYHNDTERTKSAQHPLHSN
jgi:fatty-acyl-CoA synthase